MQAAGAGARRLGEQHADRGDRRRGARLTRRRRLPRRRRLLRAAILRAPITDPGHAQRLPPATAALAHVRNDVRFASQQPLTCQCQVAAKVT